MDVTVGSVDVTTYFAFRFTATGLDATALNPTDFDLTYVRSGAASVAKVDATALASAGAAHADNAAIEVHATNQKGLYRVDWPDAAFVAGVREVILTVQVATAFTEHKSITLLADPATAAAQTTAQTSLTAIQGYLDTEIAAILAKTNLIPATPASTGDAMTLTSGERDAVAAALLDLAAGIETGLTPRQALRLIAAACAGKASGLLTATAIYRNAVADSKNRMSVSVSHGNRTAITYDLT